MENSLLTVVLLTVVSLITPNTDAFLDLRILGVGIDSIFDAVKTFPTQTLNRPSNRDNSIQYLLYTPSNRNEACLIQPSAQQFDNCSFNANHETKFLIHGFVVKLKPGNLFDDLKDALLNYGNYNVIIVNWNLYNNFPYMVAYRNAITVGKRVGEMMKFIEVFKKASLKTFHCIGHSLGCHICGVAGREARTLARITGLDPAGISLKQSFAPTTYLNYTDADFVDVIHTSDVLRLSGLGFLYPVGHQDFYPNGGIYQPRCVLGNTYKLFRGETLILQTIIDEILCNHFIVIEYFTNSIKNDCKFHATECNSLDFEKDLCQFHKKAEMGFHAKKIDGIKPRTKFYLSTLEFPPYCMKSKILRT